MSFFDFQKYRSTASVLLSIYTTLITDKHLVMSWVKRFKQESSVKHTDPQTKGLTLLSVLSPCFAVDKNPDRKRYGNFRPTPYPSGVAQSIDEPHRRKYVDMQCWILNQEGLQKPHSPLLARNIF